MKINLADPRATAHPAHSSPLAAVGQYTVIENVLQGDALQRVLDAVAVTPGGRGRHAVCEEIRELMGKCSRSGARVVAS